MSEPSDATLERAIAAFRAQRPDEAERLAADVLAARPEHILAAHVLGSARLALGRPADAVAPLELAARLSFDPANETLLARALAAAGRREEALTPLHRAIASRPPYPLAFQELGEQLAALGRLDEAARAFADGLALCPDAEGLRLGLGDIHLRRGARLLELGERGAGEAELRAAVRQAPQLAGAAVRALAAAPHGRAFLRPSDAARFLRG